MDSYYTHQRFLRKILNTFSYDQEINCLEFGAGEGSSSIFYEYAKNHSTLTVSCYERDEAWLTTMSHKYSLHNYDFNRVNDWSTFNYSSLKKSVYDLVFVDQDLWKARIETIDALHSKAKWLILHDYCYFNAFKDEEIQEIDLLEWENRIQNRISSRTDPSLGDKVWSKDWAYNCGKNSFFEKYLPNFELYGEYEPINQDPASSPPTLIFKNIQYNLTYTQPSHEP